MGRHGNHVVVGVARHPSVVAGEAYRLLVVQETRIAGVVGLDLQTQQRGSMVVRVGGVVRQEYGRGHRRRGGCAASVGSIPLDWLRDDGMAGWSRGVPPGGVSGGAQGGGPQSLLC